LKTRSDPQNHSPSHSRGVFFLLAMMSVSCANDVIAKLLGNHLAPIEIIFFRFFFSFVTLLPLVAFKGKAILCAANLKINFLRGVLGAISFYLYTYSLTRLPIVEVVTILWTTPIFGLVLSIIFLREKVSPARWIATIIGFVGLAFISLCGSEAHLVLKFLYIIPIMSALLFAAQDVMIKKMVVHENSATMLLYFAIVAAAFTLAPTIMCWQPPSLFELSLLLLLGSSANLMQWFIFKAFEAADLSALAPYRYLEFLMAAGAGYIFFEEIPGMNVITGAIIIILSTLQLALNERRQSRSRPHPMS
jgi:S-adenosylmethionine uptake transporter